MDLTKLICWRSAHYATVQSLYKNDTMGVSKNLGGYINTNWGVKQTARIVFLTIYYLKTLQPMHGHGAAIKALLHSPITSHEYYIKRSSSNGVNNSQMKTNVRMPIALYEKLKMSAT